jgi:hypothetical protein
MGVSWQLDLTNQQGPALFIKAADPCEVLFKSVVPRSPKDVPQVILCLQVFCLRYPVVEPTVGPLRAGAPCEISTEISGAFLLIVVCLREARVDEGLAAGERGSLLDVVGPVCQVLVVPNVVIIVTFNISCIFFHILNLTSSWPLHEPLDLKVFLIPESIQLVFKFLISRLCVLFRTFSIAVRSYAHSFEVVLL